MTGGQPVRTLLSPPSSLPEPRKPSSIEKGPFLRGSCRPFSTFPVSADQKGLSGGFLTSRLCIQKFRSWHLDFGTELTSRRSGIGSAEERASSRFGNPWPAAVPLDGSKGALPSRLSPSPPQAQKPSNNQQSSRELTSIGRRAQCGVITADHRTLIRSRQPD